MYSESIVLVVKGESEESEAIARTLSEHYRVVGAEKAEDALMHASNNVALVISELESHKYSGLQLLRSWKARQPRTPFLLITDGGNVDSVVEAMKLGAADCIVKPVNPSKLRAVVSRLVDRGTANVGTESGIGKDDDSDNRPNIDIPPGTSLEDLERAAVEQALAQHHGNRTHAAKTLGISVRTLQRKLKAWGMPMIAMQPQSTPTSTFLISPHAVTTPFGSHVQQM